MQKKWSSQVTHNSNALDLESGLFTWENPTEIALSLKSSAEKSTRRKTTPYRSAMSMLSFYINRSGKKLSQQQKEILLEAKQELRRLFKKNEI